MNEIAVDRGRRRHEELANEIVKLKEERDRLDPYLFGHEEFSQLASRTVSGEDIDALCQIVLRDAREPMTPSPLLAALSKQFGAVIDAANPARLVSMRISALASVGSTEYGCRLVPSSIGIESEAHE